jgi:hypothetical protein
MYEFLFLLLFLFYIKLVLKIVNIIDCPTQPP